MMTAFVLLAAGPFAFRDAGPSAVELTENGRPVFTYNYGMTLKEGVPADRRRCCYLHPVYTPAGVAVTDDFPKDHYHHRGIAWMWPEIKAGGRQVDGWMLKGIDDRFVRWVARESKPGSARLAVENGWFSAERQVLKETAEMVVYPAKQGARAIELTLTFEALGEPVEISGTHDLNKGYGGLAFRFAPRENTVIRTEAGEQFKDTDMVPHPWAELEATYQGRRAAARVIIDKRNPGFPNGWCLRPYGFLGVNYPGLTPVTLVPGRPLVLRYRVELSDK
jgi:hypothetical protein